MLIEKTKKSQKSNEISVATIQAWLKEYGFVSGAILVLGLVVVFSILAFRSNKLAKNNRASAMMADPASWEEIIIHYGSTPTAPFAYLALASQQYHSGNFALAEETYSNFLTRYPNHSLMLIAELGKINSMAAKGSALDALELYDAFLEANPLHFLAPQAVLGKGQLLTAINRLPEAKAVFEDFIASNPESIWMDTLEVSLSVVEQRMRQKPILTEEESETL
ncbi:MAG: tetratricopeptide repeat protein [Lentisphaerae bacterium]|nr:tetratricopeptide repeat protein [Lentisphaerota bacterium]